MKSMLIAAALILITPLTVQASCFGSGAFKTCSDGNGNTYNVQRYGNTTNMQGSNSYTGNTWSQNSQRYGNSTYTTGHDADGNSWNMQQHSLGNGFSTYSGTDSSGNTFSGSCNRYSGCN